MLEGIVRESISKGNVNLLRKDGYLIANIYGRGQENINCAFKRNAFIKYVKSKSGLIFPVKLGDNTYKVVIKEYQKNPVTNDIIHVDLMLALDGVQSKYMVPIKSRGIPVGLKNKGVLIFSKKKICVKCTPEHLPNEYMVDVSNLDVGHSVLIRDLPEISGVRIYEKPSVSVLGVIKAK